MLWTGAVAVAKLPKRRARATSELSQSYMSKAPGTGESLEISSV